MIIILVTHSVGHHSFKVVDKSTDYNTMFKNIKSKKLNIGYLVISL